MIAVAGPKRLRACMVSCALLGACSLAQAKLVQNVIRVTAVVQDAYGKQITREVVTTVFFDDKTPSPRPLALLLHGRAVEAADRAALGRVTFITNARWFASLGFFVAVPTRIGYGVTGGEDVEYSGDCNNKNYPPGYEAAAVQGVAVIDAARQRPDVLKDRGIVVGQSYGGTTTIALAAKNLPGIQAYVNFAGGGGGNPITSPGRPCGPARLARLFSTYGMTSRAPTMWIYTENDQYLGVTGPQEWFEGFQAAGGVGQFRRYPPHGKDGHVIFSAAPDVWRGEVLEFLKAQQGLAIAEPGTSGNEGSEGVPVKDDRK